MWRRRRAGEGGRSRCQRYRDIIEQYFKGLAADNQETGK